MTQLIDTIKGEALWALYLITLLSILLPSNKWRLFVMMAIPVITGILARNGRFWINQNIILFSSSIVLIVVTASYFGTQMVKDIVDKPEANKAKAGAFFSFLFLLFFAAIFGLSRFMTMYEPNASV
jgi:hypothetical protein